MNDKRRQNRSKIEAKWKQNGSKWKLIENEYEHQKEEEEKMKEYFE